MSKIIFVDGTKGFSPQRLASKPCGGIITSLTIIPQYLAKEGHDVTVLSLHEVVEEVNGVKYIHGIPEDQPNDYDVAVFNRNMLNNALADYFEASYKIWWLHDIVDPTYMQDESFRRMNKIVALSHYNVKSYSDFYSLPVALFATIPNGVDKSVFKPNGEFEYNPSLFICASAPVKGLYPLQFTFLNLKRVCPEAELRLYTSQSLHELEDSEGHKKMLSKLAELGVNVLPPITQGELAKVMQNARALLMPNHYPEICSNLLLQAQACGLPVVASDIGSANEFIVHGETGLLTSCYPHDMFWWHKSFAEQTMRILTDEALYMNIHIKAPKNVFSWEQIGEEWNKMIEGSNN